MAIFNPSTFDQNKIITELDLERAKFTRALTAQNTQTGYRYDQQVFRAWGKEVGRETLPASSDTIGLWITAMLVRGLKTSTVARRVAAVVRLHRDTGHPNPVTEDTRNLLKGARRLKAEQIDRVLPLALEELRSISALLLKDDTPLSTRNRCIVLVGFSAALRNSNTVALLLDDVEFCDQGAILTIRRSKTDQEGQGALIGLHHAKHPETCPVISLRKWIERRGAFPGPLFTRFDGRGPQDRPLLPERIGQIVQQLIKRIGKDARLYGGHSLRAGFATEAGLHGASELLIAATTGHKDMSTLRQYFRRRDVFTGNALAQVDL